MRVAYAPIEKLDDTGRRKINMLLRDIVTAINAIEFVQGGKVENMFCDYSSFVTPDAAGTELAIPHELKRAPVGYFVLSQTATANFYDGSTTNTTGTLYVRSDTIKVTGAMIII